MKDFGLINLTKNGEPFPVYFSTSGGKLSLSYEHQTFGSPMGKVMVRYEGVFAGTTADLDNFIFSEVESYLIDNGFLIKIGKTIVGEDFYKLSMEKAEC